MGKWSATLESRHRAERSQPVHESNAEQLQASSVLPVRAYPALRGALTGAPCESCSMQQARGAQERGLEAGAGSGGGRADCTCSNVSPGVKGMSSRGEEARRRKSCPLAVEAGLRLELTLHRDQLYAYNHRDVFALWEPRWRSQQPVRLGCQGAADQAGSRSATRYAPRLSLRLRTPSTD